VSETVDLITLDKFQDEADLKFPVWADGHKSDFIGTIPSDRNDEHQRIEVVEFDAQPSLEIAAQIGRIGLGSVSDTIVGDLQRLGVVDLVRKRHQQKKSTLISTLHLTSVLDAAASHNQLFVASEDEDFAHFNVLIANPMLAWTTIKGINAMLALRKSGRIIRGIPPEGAAKYDLSDELVDFVDRLAAPAMIAAFEDGNAINRAPSGTRAKKIILDDGRIGLSVNRLNTGQARTIRKRTNIAVGIPLDVQGDDTVGAVLKPREIKEDKDAHIHMEEMVDTMNAISDHVVVYGMPPGATELKRD